MGPTFAILLTVLTSILGYQIAKRFRPLSAQSFFQAVGTLLDWVGLFTLFTGANLVLGMLLILAVRGFTPRFVSLYGLDDILLLILPAIQAFVFLQWCKRK
jgi:hypothetical protein